MYVIGGKTFSPKIDKLKLHQVQKTKQSSPKTLGAGPPRLDKFRQERSIKRKIVSEGHLDGRKQRGTTKTNCCVERNNSLSSVECHDTQLLRDCCFCAYHCRHLPRTEHASQEEALRSAHCCPSECARRFWCPDRTSSCKSFGAKPEVP